MKFKEIVIAIIAIILAFFLFGFIWSMLGFIWSVTFELIRIIIILAIAYFVFLLLKKLL